jgi:hypothetical protein
MNITITKTTNFYINICPICGVKMPTTPINSIENKAIKREYCYYVVRDENNAPVPNWIYTCESKLCHNMAVLQMI